MGLRRGLAIVSGNGTHVGNAHTGVKQGDPLGAFFFCYGLQPALKEIHTEVVNSRDLSNMPPRLPDSLDGLNRGGLDNGSARVGILAYIDDITLYTNVESAVAVARIAKSVLEKRGFMLSASKCHFLGRRADELKDVQGDLGFNIQIAGLMLLGNPVGTAQYRLEAIGKILQDQLQPLEALHTIKHLTTLAFQIIRKCINSRATYLARVCEPHREAKYLFHLFDLYINAGLTCLSDYRSRAGSENFWDVQHLVITPYLRALPTSMGGLGLPLHGGLAGSYGCLRSRFLTHSFLDSYPATFGTLLAEKRKWCPVSLIESKDLRDWNFFPSCRSPLQNSWFAVQTLQKSTQAIVVVFPTHSFLFKNYAYSSSTRINTVTDLTPSSHFSSLPQNSALRTRMQAPRDEVRDDYELVIDRTEATAKMLLQHHQDKQWLHSILRQFGWFDCAAWLLHSCFEKSGSIFAKIGGAGFFEARRFSHGQFKDCLSLRLMLPVVPLQQDPSTDDYKCRCGANVNLLKDRFHCLGCTHFQGTFNQRHYAVVKELNSAMVTDKEDFVIPLSSETSTSCEVTLSLPYRDTIPAHQIGLEIGNATDTPQAVTPVLPTRADIAPTRRADLGFVGRGNIRFIVDVGIMAPTAKSYVQEYGTDLRQNSAHVHIEGQKDRRYEPYLYPITPLKVTYALIPFIVDCTGSLGAKAHAFFEEQAMCDRRKKPAIRKIQSIVALFNAVLRGEYRSACIPPIDTNTGKRMVTILDPNQSSRGRPRGSRGRNSRGTQQVEAIRNLDVSSHINLLVANPATTPDPVGTTPNIVTGNEERLNTGQT